jgi:hypothetical protein
MVIRKNWRDGMDNLEQHVVNQIERIERDHGDQIAVDQYKHLLKQLEDISAKRAMTQPPTLVDPVSLEAAMKRIGIAAPRNQEMRTRPEAQINMDLFKDDPEANEIYQAIIVKGFRALNVEGGRL